MGKTTNILDLNNRLEKVEKGNVAQNNYNSLKNRPKINGNLLTGDKTGSQLGLADAQDITDINTDIGNMSDLGTTATDLVGGINEVNSRVNSNVFLEGVNIKGITYTCPSDGYITLAKSEGTTGRFLVKVNNKYLLTSYLDKMGTYENRSLYVKKGFVIDDSSTADTNSYEVTFIPLGNP